MMVRWAAAAQRKYLNNKVQTHASYAHHSGQRVTLTGAYDEDITVESNPGFVVADYDPEAAEELMASAIQEEAPVEPDAPDEASESDDSSDSSSDSSSDASVEEAASEGTKDDSVEEAASDASVEEAASEHPAAETAWVIRRLTWAKSKGKLESAVRLMMRVARRGGVIQGHTVTQPVVVEACASFPDLDPEALD